MPKKINYFAIENRMKQGAAAAAATFAMTAVTSYRMGQERGAKVKPGKVIKFSAIVGTAAGVTWALMPRAKDPPSETIEEAKENVYPAFKVAVNRMIDHEDILQGTDDRYGSVYSSTSTRQRSLERVNRRYGISGFDDDFDYDSPSEDDFISDDEFGDILEQDLLDDPFFEGPGSVFDRM